MNGTVLFDEICNLCNMFVRFIRNHNKGNRFRFVPLRSEEGKKLLIAAGLLQSENGTAVYLRDDKYYLRSSAVLNILKDMGGAWKICFVFIIVPALFRDFIYRLIARSRYTIFGRKDSC